MVEMMKGFIDQQIATYQKGHVRNYIDLYIEEMNEAEQRNETSDFTYDQLVMMATDFLFPSLVGVETQIAFLFRTLLHKPDILKKIQDEIDGVVGSGRLPELDDRIK